MSAPEKPIKIKGSEVYLSKIIAGSICLSLGAILLIARLGFFQSLFNFLNKTEVLRSVAWSFVGIGAGLVNTRVDKPSSCWPLHYFGYYGFMLVVVSLASFLASRYSLSWDNSGSSAEPSAALIGLVAGFMSHKFHDWVSPLLKKGTV